MSTGRGFLLVALAILVAIALHAVALQRRSWSLWLVAFGFTVLSLLVAAVARA